MIRSSRIPSVLRRICHDETIQTALLVTTDGELLGSTATTFLSPDGTTRESIESLGTLIADIAVDYGKLGDEYANLDPGGAASAAAATATTTTTAPSTTASPPVGGGASVVSATSAASSSVVGTSPQGQSSTTSGGSSTLPSHKKSHLQCLFLELELGLVAVSSCVGVDCMVIAICSPNAPLGGVRARLQAITAHVEQALSPLAMTEAAPSSYHR